MAVKVAISVQAPQRRASGTKNKSVTQPYMYCSRRKGQFVLKTEIVKHEDKISDVLHD
jgi:hypothetical protein